MHLIALPLLAGMFLGQAPAAEKTKNEDARIAAAAIISLLPAGEMGPQGFEAKDVKTTQDKGWTCTCRIHAVFPGEARVTFDANGRCTSITMPNIRLPRPPSARPG
jgi:hypothetical protein